MTDRLLYLVRHGDCHEDGPRLPNGDHDGSLTDLGREQAGLVSERLAGVPFATIHHSSLRRATQTAELIAARHPGVPVRSSDLLRECVPAVPERSRLAPAQAAFFDGFADIPGALTEGPEQAAAAVAEFGGTTSSGAPELVVSHGNVISWFTGHAIDAPPWAWLNMVTYAGALTVILFRDDTPSRLVVFNDAGHLPPALRGTEYPDAWRT